MANKFSVGATRSDIFFIDPADVVADEGLNGRFTEHDTDSVEALADSYAERGQLQAVLVRRDHQHRPVLVAGFRRWRAARLFNERHPDAPMKLMCRLTTCNEEEAFLSNIAENIERKQTSPIDDAHNMRRLMERFGWTLQGVATLYKKSTSYCCTLSRLLTLPKPVQMQVHRGELVVSAAIALTSLPVTEQQEVLAQATTPVDAGGAPGVAVEISNTVIKDAVASKRRERGEKQARGVRELKTLLGRLQEVTESERAKEVADLFFAVIGGEHGDEEAVSLLNTLLS